MAATLLLQFDIIILLKYNSYNFSNGELHLNSVTQTGKTSRKIPVVRHSVANISLQNADLVGSI
jgi:hypothetical protein